MIIDQNENDTENPCVDLNSFNFNHIQMNIINIKLPKGYKLVLPYESLSPKTNNNNVKNIFKANKNKRTKNEVNSF